MWLAQIKQNLLQKRVCKRYGADSIKLNVNNIGLC